MPGIRTLTGRDGVHEDTEEGPPGQNGVQGRLLGVGRALLRSGCWWWQDQERSGLNIKHILRCLKSQHLGRGG